MRKLDLTAEDMADLLNGDSINAMVRAARRSSLPRPTA